MGNSIKKEKPIQFAVSACNIIKKTNNKKTLKKIYTKTVREFLSSVDIDYESLVTIHSKATMNGSFCLF